MSHYGMEIILQFPMTWGLCRLDNLRSYNQYTALLYMQWATDSPM